MFIQKSKSRKKEFSETKLLTSSHIGGSDRVWDRLAFFLPQSEKDDPDLFQNPHRHTQTNATTQSQTHEHIHRQTYRHGERGKTIEEKNTNTPSHTNSKTQAHTHALRHMGMER